MTTIVLSHILNFYSWLLSLFFTPKPSNILVLGLDNSGKTTLCHYLYSSTQQSPLREYPPRTPVLIGGSSFNVFEHRHGRIPDDDYWSDIQGILFLVSARESDRFDEVKRELDRLRSNQRIENIPIAVLGNKIDRVDAVGEQELRSALGVQSECSSGRPLKVFMTSIVCGGAGIKEAFQWLAHKS